jgi:hypothetical protein
VVHDLMLRRQKARRVIQKSAERRVLKTSNSGRQEPKMRLASVFLILIMFGVSTACSSAERSSARAQEDAAEAQEAVSEKRLELVEQYEDCMKDAEGDPGKQSGCDQYLKAADSLR